ncbi:hypothetical protein [Corynebacterium freneyi]|uniref:Uncharacterized protein n=1 Tax=Corynebacterium freneyi TaxID=134034 RepID=A0ABS4UA02_9CORY|nr:hypothetical protein [Corynebacterium freneyi]MBP2333345.1 hypothetical protein [Corynebacterium freneyi]QXA52604.1 hypothetical protein I6L56_11260 [Corynebacterium freneyi]WJZ04551.1 hypothetical protein CFREN_02825 [Corynebacterium freneyi]
MAAYFSTMATVLPVLLVAGLIDKVTLREYSKTRYRSKFAKISVSLALIAVYVAATMVAVPEENVPEWLSTAAAAVCAGSLGNLLVFIAFLVWHSLDEDPHPDRVQTELREAKARVRALESKAENDAEEGTAQP